MKKKLFILSCAVVAFVDRLCGREFAINAVAESPDPALAVGLPSGLSSTAVAARKAALIAAGTPPIYAEKFAIDAEQQQAWHDNPKLREGSQANAKTAAEQEAQAILDAQQIDPSKLKKPSTQQLGERQQIVDDAAAAAEKLAGMTVDDLRSLASDKKIELTSDMKKADIIAAIQEALK